MGDACLGISRLRAAASSSHALCPFQCDGPFIDDADVKDLFGRASEVGQKPA